MPNEYYEKYRIEIRTNEHNHKKQSAHVHIYITGEEVGSVFLDGTLRDGDIPNRHLKKIAKIVLDNADYYQELWDEYQSSEY
ncbi:MAG: DUF4160 domain-containing protein [Lactococcus raffinolactis]|uniref:DUF4160 domain-containing protein n=1 Tax=Pseudolactococcus raffinolactis TaxID=1366 RepID=UPI003996070E